jgi:hypothetical protein
MRTIANVRSKPWWRCDDDGDASHSSERQQHDSSYNTMMTAMSMITMAVSTTQTTFTPMATTVAVDGCSNDQHSDSLVSW